MGDLSGNLRDRYPCRYHGGGVFSSWWFMINLIRGFIVTSKQLQVCKDWYRATLFNETNAIYLIHVVIDSKGGGWVGGWRAAVEARQGVHGRSGGRESHDKRKDVRLVYLQQALGEAARRCAFVLFREAFCRQGGKLATQNLLNLSPWCLASC